MYFAKDGFSKSLLHNLGSLCRLKSYLQMNTGFHTPTQIRARTEQEQSKNTLRSVPTTFCLIVVCYSVLVFGWSHLIRVGGSIAKEIAPHLAGLLYVQVRDLNLSKAKLISILNCFRKPLYIRGNPV